MRPWQGKFNVILADCGAPTEVREPTAPISSLEGKEKDWWSGLMGEFSGGALGKGIAISPVGLRPDYNQLKAIV